MPFGIIPDLAFGFAGIPIQDGPPGPEKSSERSYFSIGQAL